MPEIACRHHAAVLECDRSDHQVKWSDLDRLLSERGFEFPKEACNGISNREHLEILQKGLKYGDILRRAPFPNTDDASVSDIQATGLKALGGPDLQATRLWWDVEN